MNPVEEVDMVSVSVHIQFLPVALLDLIAAADQLGLDSSAD